MLGYKREHERPARGVKQSACSGVREAAKGSCRLPAALGRRQAHRQRRPCYLYAFSGMGDLCLGFSLVCQCVPIDSIVTHVAAVCMDARYKLYNKIQDRQEMELDMNEAGMRRANEQFRRQVLTLTCDGRNVLDFLRRSFGGGTYLEDALAETARRLEQEAWRNAAPELHACAAEVFCSRGNGCKSLEAESQRAMMR